MRLGQGDIYNFPEIEITSDPADPIVVPPPKKTDWGRLAALAAAWGIPLIILILILTTRKKRR